MTNKNSEEITHPDGSVITKKEFFNSAPIGTIPTERDWDDFKLWVKLSKSALRQE